MIKPAQSTQNLVIDVTPLQDDEYTGISNVICEIASRALAANDIGIEFQFSAAGLHIPPVVIESCVRQHHGATLREALKDGIRPTIEEASAIDLSRDVGLYLHVKPPYRRFRKEAHLYYDFSYLSAPETHDEGNIQFHLNGLIEQIATTDHFFTISESTARDLQWFFDVPEERTTVTYLGHNTNLAMADDFLVETAGRAPEPYILCLGTIEPRKNIPMLLAWLAQHPEVLETWRLVFCGRHGWGPTFPDLVAEHGLGWAADAGRLMHLGFVSQRQKAALLAAAQLLVYPSLSEGFGLPVLEAMAQSVPVLASCSTSIPEVMGDDGLYFDPYALGSFHRAFAQFIRERANGTLGWRVARLRERAAAFTYDRMFATMVTTMARL